MTYLYVVDTICYSCALLLIASSRMKKNKLQYTLAFLFLIIIQLSIGANSYFSILTSGIVLSACFWQKQNSRKCVYECFYCVSILAIWIILISSLFLLIFSDQWLKSPLLRVIMDIILISIGIAWKATAHYCKKNPEHFQGQRLRIGVLLLLLFFYTFVMNTIQFDHEKDLAMLSLLFIVLIFLITSLFNQLIHTQEKQKQQDLQQEYMEHITNAYQQSVERDHYFIQLLKSMKKYIAENNIKELTHYFEKHIEPIAKNAFALSAGNDIKNKLIRNLVQNEINDLAKQQNLLIDCEFIGNINLANHLISDVFKLLAECFSNAKKELQQQKDRERAYIQIHFIEVNGMISFKIANSISNPSNNYFSVKQKENGGSRMFQRILQHHLTIEYSSYIRVLPLGGFTVFVQEIMIDTKEDNHNDKSTTRKVQRNRNRMGDQ